MFVLLLHPQTRSVEFCHPPYTLLQLASIADQHGWNVAILDDNVLKLPPEALRQDLKNEASTNKQPWDIIGIIGTSKQYKFIKQLASICREEFPKAVIFGAGEFTTSLPSEMIKWIPQLDIGIVGEEYRTFTKILEHSASHDWENINGIAYRDGGIVRLTKKNPPIKDVDDAIPFPGYEWGQLNQYLMYSAMPYAGECMTQQTRRLDVLTSYPNPFRQHSPEYVIKLLTYLRLKYAVNFISFIDTNLPNDKTWFLKFCELLEETELSTVLCWGMDAHYNSVDANLLKKANDVGCRYIRFNGDATYEEMAEIIRHSKAASINPILNFTIGKPNMTVDRLIQDLEFFIENQIATVPDFVQPYPETPLFSKFKDKIIEQNLTNPEESFLLMPTPQALEAVSREGLIQTVGEITQSWINKNFEMLKTTIRENTIQRWLSSLGGSNEMSVNMTQFSDVEIAGLRYLISTDGVRLTNKAQDLKRLELFASYRRT